MTFRSLLVFVLLTTPCVAWSPTVGRPLTATRLFSERLTTTLSSEDESVQVPPSSSSSSGVADTRRSFVSKGSAALLFGGFLTVSSAALPSPSNALVKGVAPPPKSKPSSGDRPKCTSIDECEALGERREKERKEAESQGPPPLVTAKGTRYRDVEIGNEKSDPIQVGDEVTLYYKILKLGKRSYDGISGEGTVVFSKGYGLEDDEEKPGVKSFITTVGAPQNIVALNDAVVGMYKDGIRRFAVMPQAGWEKATKLCDGGPGGQGAGGEIKTDFVVVPTATMVSTESCFDQSKLPFPTTYAEQRRMAQRFDQSLLMEIQVVAVDKNPTIPL